MVNKLIMGITWRFPKVVVPQARWMAFDKRTYKQWMRTGGAPMTFRKPSQSSHSVDMGTNIQAMKPPIR